MNSFSIPLHLASGLRLPHAELRLLTMAAILLLGGFSGCAPDTKAPRSTRAAPSDMPAKEHLDIALEYIERLDDFQELQARGHAAYQLNRWLEVQKSLSEWKPDDMVNRIPRVVRERGALDELPRRQFSVDDIRFIQESVWMRQLSSWISRQPLPGPFEKWLNARSEQLGSRETEQLGVAFRLFDWTVRNVQLVELIPYPDEAAKAPVAGAAAQQANAPAPARGVPGPGYHLDPSQVLVFGQGDAWQRMRVFTLLARQQGLDVVVLSFPGRSNPPRPRPWVTGLLLKDQLYLFDSKLGIPIPSRGFEGIATLQEVLDDPNLLESLAVDEKHPYGIEKQDLSEIAALIDVVTPNLSMRMQILETQLAGDHRTVLSVPLSPLAKRLRACRGVFDVYVWSIPFEALWYRDTYERNIRNDDRMAAQHMIQRGMFQDHMPLVQARYRYFRGEIESDEAARGAKALLMQARVPQEQIEQIGTNEEMQRQLGLVRAPGETDVMWNARLGTVKSMMTATKQHVSFWLGLLQLEAGRNDSAIEWLKTRSLDVWPDGLWAPAARYNLARAYEAQGAFDKAQQLLLSDKSPQEHGNYLRAKMLQKQLSDAKAKGEDRTKPTDAKPTEEKPTEEKPTEAKPTGEKPTGEKPTEAKPKEA